MGERYEHFKAIQALSSPEALASRFVLKNGGKDGRKFLAMLGLDQPKHQPPGMFNRGPQIRQGDPLRHSTTPKYIAYV